MCVYVWSLEGRGGVVCLHSGWFPYVYEPVKNVQYVCLYGGGTLKGSFMCLYSFIVYDCQCVFMSVG